MAAQVDDNYWLHKDTYHSDGGNMDAAIRELKLEESELIYEGITVR